MVRPHPQYTEYEVSIDSKMVCIWLTKSSVSATELNLKLKPLANDIKISPNYEIYCYVIPNRQNMKLQLILR